MMSPPQTLEERVDEHDTLIYKMMRLMTRLSMDNRKIMGAMNLTPTTDAEVEAELEA